MPLGTKEHSQLSEATYEALFCGIFHFTLRLQFSSVQFSCSVVSDSSWPHESQHARPPCPSPTPRVHSNSRPSSRWCHPAISSSVVPFSSFPQSLPASESFPMSQLFAWGGQSTGVSALASFLPKKSQGWSPSEWTGCISLQSKGLSRVFWGCTELLKVLSPFSALGIQGPSPQPLCSGRPVEVCKRRAFRQGGLCQHCLRSWPPASQVAQW